MEDGRRDDADDIGLLSVEHLFEVRVMRRYSLFLRDFFGAFGPSAGHRHDFGSWVVLKHGDLDKPAE